MKIKKGDTIKVMIGKDKGKTAKIIKVLSRKKMVLVEGVNEYKKHKKARTLQEKSEIITISKPLDISKVALIEPKSKKPSRVGYKMEKGKKIRITKRSNEKIT